MHVRSIVIVSAVAVLSGSVSSGKYDEAVRDATSARADRDRVATERKELDARVRRLSDVLHALTERAAERDAALVSAGKRGDDLQKSFEVGLRPASSWTIRGARGVTPLGRG